MTVYKPIEAIAYKAAEIAVRLTNNDAFDEVIFRSIMVKIW